MTHLSRRKSTSAYLHPSRWLAIELVQKLGVVPPPERLRLARKLVAKARKRKAGRKA